MKNIELLPHNEVAYKKLLESLTNHQMTSINHATGTGKSFIILKYLYQNNEKRILYLAPTYPILEQLIEEHMKELDINIKEFNQFNTMIYANLLEKNMKNLAKDFDIIILDEYHRCGAEEWGKQVKELLEEIRKKYPNTKVIGTTATEVRYLDNTRNMNQALFNGVEASKLTLADAILEGILPVPIYINFNYNLLNELNQLENNVEKYTFYRTEKIKLLKHLKIFQNQIENTFLFHEKLEKYLQDKKKILVFSSNINKIEEDRKIIQKILPKIDNDYVLHSKIDKKINSETLKKFRNDSSDKTSVLYSIDILNEGVHVKGVDAICMMRPTTSPIIYLQQLGRLLSFSRRNDEVLVLDFVNNIKNHPMIYTLYQDVITRAAELIKEHPENEQRYRKVLNNFSIVEKSSILSKKMDDMKELYSKDALLERRLLKAISILEDSTYQNEVEKFQAQMDILKYEKYITLDMYDRINKIKGIKKPSIMNYTKEEFRNLLSGKKNVNESNKPAVKNIYKELVAFYDLYNHLPTVLSTKELEKKLAVDVLNNYYRFSTKMKEYIFNNISSDLSIFEKNFYGMEIQIENQEEFLKELKNTISSGFILNLDAYSYLTEKIDNQFLNKLVEDNQDKYYDLREEQRKNTKKNSIDKNILFHKQLEQTTTKVLEDLDKVSIQDYVENLFIDIKDFMKKYHKEVEFADYDSSLTYEERKIERDLYCKKMILNKSLSKMGYLEQINKLAIDLKINKEYNYIEQNIDTILKFIEEHQGALPSVRNKNNTLEVTLAKFYLKNHNKFREEDLEKIKSIQNKYSNQKNKVLKDYITFIKENGRKPILDKSYIEEMKLNENLNRWISYYTKEELVELNQTLKSLNKYNALRKAYYDLYNQKENKNKVISLKVDKK